MAAIAGVFGVPDAAETVLRMLQAMQHRGQGAAGIASFHDGATHDIRGPGLVDHIFERTDFPSELPGESAIGHIRRGPEEPHLTQPFVRRHLDLELAIVHAGQLTNGAALRSRYQDRGGIFVTHNDAEIMFHAAAHSGGQDDPFLTKLVASFPELQGAWTMLLIGPGALVAAVDPLGYRPLAMAPYRGGFAFASETCALDLLDEKPAAWTVIDPGTMIVVKKDSLRIERFAPKGIERHCIFEYVYFSRPDSYPSGISAHEVRSRLGARLAVGETDIPEVICSVPDSSNAMASGYAKAIGVPSEPGFLKNHYAGAVTGSNIPRATRFGARMKLGVARPVVDGKAVTVVVGSMIHGKSAGNHVSLLRNNGATKVHLRIASPPVVRGCPYGVNEPNTSTLIAPGRTTEEIRAITGADSLRFATIDDLHDALGPDSRNRNCTECFGGPCAPPSPAADGD